jgi:hypothetical protein
VLTVPINLKHLAETQSIGESDLSQKSIDEAIESPWTACEEYDSSREFYQMQNLHQSAALKLCAFINQIALTRSNEGH